MPKASRGWTAFLFPSLRGYDRSWLSGDLVAGLTVWAVLVPEALAYASIAGVSPVVGLYAAPGALLLYAAFGRSRHLIVGTDVGDRRALGRGGGRPRQPSADAFVTITTALAITTGVVASPPGCCASASSPTSSPSPCSRASSSAWR